MTGIIPFDLEDTVYADQGRYSEAEKLYERALAGNEEKLGLTHFNTLRTVQNLANVCADQGRYSEAEKLRKYLTQK